MSEETAPNDEELSFDRAEPTAQAASEGVPDVPSCAACKRPLGEEHFTLNENPICADCHHLVSHQLKESKGFEAFMRAAGFGAAAALGGSIAWYAVARITGMEIGLIAIAVGYMVGRSVRRGSRGPGGRRYQALAMLLTYLSITGSYVPAVIKSAPDANFFVVYIVALIAPFLGGASNILGLVLIGIALYEAWKLNRTVPFILDGPRRTVKREG